MSSIVVLDDLVDFRKGKKPTELLDVPVDSAQPFYQIDELRGLKTPRFAVDNNGTQVSKDDICIVWDGANAGTIGYGLEGLIGSTITRMRLKQPDKVYAPYLGRFLQSKFVLINGTAQGAAIPHLHGSQLRELVIALPAIKEQRRIATMFDKADAIQRKRKQLIELTNSLLKSIFIEMFGSPSQNPYGWPVMTIGDIAEATQYGTSSKAGAVGEYPVLRMNNLTYDGNIDLADMKYIDIVRKDVDKYTVVKGDILFNRTNSADLVGKTAVYQGEDRIAFAGYLIRLRTNKQAVPEYVSAFLNSTYGKSILRKMCRSIIGMANINAKELRSIFIPVPPIRLQLQYQKRFEAIREFISSLKDKINIDNELQFSLARSAFSGKL